MSLTFNYRTGIITATTFSGGGASITGVDADLLEGGNAASFATSGHTHTGSTISALDAGDTTGGIFAADRIPTHTGHVTGQTSLSLVVAAITGQAALTTGLATTDELVLSDGGVIKRMDISVLTTHLNTNLALNANRITAGTLVVLRGGTGVTTKTGTGNVVLSISPALTGTPTSGGNTLATLATNWAATDITTGTLAVLRGGTGVTTKTGTGNVVLSATPTFTGTPVFANIRINTNVDLNGNINGDGASIIDGIETINIDGTGDITKVSHGNYLYHKSTAYDNDQNGEITLSTSAASGGTTGDIWFKYTA